jgi:hypothetical protein
MIKSIKHHVRKRKHIHYMTQTVCDLHNEIFNDALNEVINKNKALLIKKYNRRLKLILY